MKRRLSMILMTASLILAGTGIVLAETDRETWQPPEQILDAAGVRAGMRIGEAGAGTGFLTFHLAKRVGDEGVVFANDISASGLAAIRGKAERDGVSNIVTVMGEIEDPVFPENDLDMVVMVYVLHCLERPVRFMNNLKGYLKSGAPVVIVERNTHHERAHYPAFMTNRQILETIQESGYELVRTETFLPRDTIYIYQIAR
ncbi:MAG: class I SAM-dependent methyltransferase [bacterium]|nr:class I SAM-dependent methyltransferase [bacterium]